MPATFLTYPGGGAIFPVSRGRRKARRDVLALDRQYLCSFGEMRVPRELWQAMQRFAAWIEPALVAEWIRLMSGYAVRQGAAFDGARAWAATAWSDPAREVAASRAVALRLLGDGRAVHCVWSGRRLDAPALDIDHCLPWSAWPCGDLWNLMPAHRAVNQRQKRDRLPSAEALASAGDAIRGWWTAAYVEGGGAIGARFAEEAAASLPALLPAGHPAGPDEIFRALALQRARLRQNQRVPEWDGAGHQIAPG